MQRSTLYTLLVLGSGILVAGGIVLSGAVSDREGTPAPKAVSALLSGSEFEQKFLATEGAVLIDVRTPAEFAASHIGGAVNVDFENPNFAAEIAKLDPKTPYFIYCRSGNRSGQAAPIMRRAGIMSVTDLRGGIVASPELLGKNLAKGVPIDIGTKTAESIQLTASAGVALTAEEKAGLLFMREEEKLAHDVYVTLSSQWDLPIFANIAQSEATHTLAIRSLLLAYGVADPVADTPVGGVFTDPKLQSLYNDLVKRGSASLSEALTVGALIEDLDIVDLQKRIAKTDKPNITLVYENLMKGSRNHLRSFTGQLSSRGVTYTPTYLSTQEFQSIISSPRESGGGQMRGKR